MAARTFRIAPSILSAIFARLGDEWLRSSQPERHDHFDVMDNHYVRTSPWTGRVRGNPRSSRRHRVHLMVRPSIDHSGFRSRRSQRHQLHPEASEHVDRTVGLIHDSGCKAGLALKPRDALSCLDQFAQARPGSHHVVNPGFGGQQFIARLDKLRCAQEDRRHGARDMLEWTAA